MTGSAPATAEGLCGGTHTAEIRRHIPLFQPRARSNRHQNISLVKTCKNIIISIYYYNTTQFYRLYNEINGRKAQYNIDAAISLANTIMKISVFICENLSIMELFTIPARTTHLDTIADLSHLSPTEYDASRLSRKAREVCG